MEQCLQEVLLDDEWMALEEAAVILLDAPEWQMPSSAQSKQRCGMDWRQASLSGLHGASKQPCPSRLPASADDPMAAETRFKGMHALFGRQ